MISTRRTLLATTAALAIALASGAPGQALAQGPGGPQMQGRAMQMFARCDTSGDGQISQDEFDACRTMRFGQIDTNGDGKVTLDEFQAKGTGRNPQRQQMMFRQMDVNGDGMVTESEFESMHETRFDQIDTNGDGQIAPAEVQQMHQTMRKPGMGQGMGPCGPGTGQGMGPCGPGTGQGMGRGAGGGGTPGQGPAQK